MSASDNEQEFRQYRFSAPPGAADLLIVRHGESMPARVGQSFPTVDGRADPPLDPHGRAEAERVAARLADAGVDAIYVTPLRRTSETAAPLAARVGIAPVVEPALAEVYLGEWEGAVFRAKIVAHDPLVKRLFTEERWDVIPGAEPGERFQQRIRTGIARIAAAHPDQRVVVVTHGGVIGTLMSMATGARPFAFINASNASITHLVVTPEQWIVRRFNDTAHLDTDLDRPLAAVRTSNTWRQSSAGVQL